MANAVSPTTGTVVAIVGGGIGFGAAAAVRRRRPAPTPRSSCVAALGLPRRRRCSRARMDRDLLGPDLDGEPPRPREAVRRRRRAGWSTAPRHVWHAPAGAARAGRDRRAPLLLRRLDHRRRSCCSATTSTTRTTSTPGLAGLGAGRSRRRAPASSSRRVVTPAVDRADRASSAGSRSASRWPPRPRPCSSSAVSRVAAARRRRSCSASPPRARRSASTRSCRRRSTTTSAAGSSRSTTCMFNVAFVAAAAFGALVLPADGNSPRGLRRGRRSATRVTAVVLRPRHRATVTARDRARGVDRRARGGRAARVHAC